MKSGGGCDEEVVTYEDPNDYSGGFNNNANSNYGGDNDYGGAGGY